MVHRRAGRQLVGQTGKGRRRRPRARGVDDVVAEEAHRQHASTGVARHAARRVQREHVEEHGIAGLELPPEDAEVIGPSVDVGQLGERAVGEPLRLIVHERSRHVPLAAVRAGDELQRRLHRHRVDGEPHAGVLPPVDVVVRLVLVPRRALARPRLLDEHVVVVQPHGAWRPSARPAMAAAPDSRANRSISGIRCQLQKSSTNAPSSALLARLASGDRSARLASIASRASSTYSADTAPRTQTAPSRTNLPPPS